MSDIQPARRRTPARTFKLRCRVVGVEGKYAAPNLGRFDLSYAERLAGLQPSEITLMLKASFGAGDQETAARLADISRSGGYVTVSLDEA